ncbi:YncE family protein [Paenibacillus lautus]|uniref:YncE family protein n=1 Tax=Paenibacillus lautus TaxID=1401 RepID=UPI00203B3C86|nr:YncE family protein [Paenibacillus lautus]MCM3257096.1 YncE family protein [Paenibacillus lautus]
MGNLFVSNRGNGTVSVIRPDSLVSTLATMGAGSSSVATSPDFSRLYVVNSASNTVSVFSLVNGALLRQFSVGQNPVDIAISSEGNYGYVLNRGSGTVTPFNLIFYNLLNDIPIESGALSIKLSPNNQVVYIAYDTEIIVYNANLTNIITRHPVRGARFMELTPDGNKLVCTNADRSSVTLINLPYTTGATRVERIIRSGPQGISITKNGLFAYICCTTGNAIQVVGISGDTPILQRVVAPIDSPYDITFDLNDDFYYVTSPVNNVVYSLSRSGDRLLIYRNNNPTNPFNFSTPFNIIITPDLFSFIPPALATDGLALSATTSSSEQRLISTNNYPPPYLSRKVRIKKISFL